MRQRRSTGRREHVEEWSGKRSELTGVAPGTVLDG